MEALCKQLLGHPALGLPGRKMQFGASRRRLQVGAQGVLPAGAQHGADRPRLVSSLLQGQRGCGLHWALGLMGGELKPQHKKPLFFRNCSHRQRRQCREERQGPCELLDFSPAQAKLSGAWPPKGRNADHSQSLRNASGSVTFTQHRHNCSCTEPLPPWPPTTILSHHSELLFACSGTFFSITRKCGYSTLR